MKSGDKIRQCSVAPSPLTPSEYWTASRLMVLVAREPRAILQESNLHGQISNNWWQIKEMADNRGRILVVFKVVSYMYWWAGSITASPSQVLFGGDQETKMHSIIA